MKKVKGLVILLSGTLLLTTACEKKDAEEPSVEILQEDEENAYATAVVEYGDVMKEIKISCRFHAMEEESLSFPIDNRLIVQVNARSGDYVTKGQVLAAVEMPDLEEKLADTETELESLELKKKQTQELMDFDLSSAEVMYGYTKQTQQDKNSLKEKKEDIARQYRTAMEDLEDSISLLQERKQGYQKQKQDGRIVAGMSGEVTYSEENILNTYCKKDSTLFTISNRESCYFETDTSYADSFREGVPVQVDCRYVGQQVSYEAVPALMEQWDNAIYFKPTGEEIIPVGISGTITLEPEQRKNVLRVPLEALHNSEKGPFVYLDTGGLLEMRYVSIGMEGDSFAEITKGLEEGDTVTLKKAEKK